MGPRFLPTIFSAGALRPHVITGHLPHEIGSFYRSSDFRREGASSWQEDRKAFRLLWFGTKTH